MTRWPRRIDRFIVGELLRSAVAGSLVAFVVLLCLQGMRLSEFIVKYDLERGVILRMLFGLGLSFMPLVVPIAILFALLGVFGRMSTDREFVAAQAMGISPTRLLRPGLVFGVVAGAVTLWVAFSVGPSGNRAFEATIDESFKKKVAASLRSGTFTEGFLDMVLFVDKIDAVTQELDRVFLHDTTNFQEEASISARRGRWIAPRDNDSLGILKLTDGVVVSRDTEREIVRRVKFDEYRIYADFSSAAGRAKESPASMGWKALMKKRAADPLENRVLPIWIEIAQRFSLAFSCFLFVPLAFALSIDNRRTAKSRAVMSGLILLFAYWTIYFSIMTGLLRTRAPWVLSSEPFVWLMMWIPNILLAGFGYWNFRKKRSGMSS